MKPYFVIFLCLLGYATSAQKIIFANSFDSEGLPKYPARELVMQKGTAIAVSVGYAHGKAMNTRKTYIFLDRLDHLGEFKEYRSKLVRVSAAAAWAADTVVFEEDGRYLISYADEQKKIMATDTLWIRYENEVLFCKEISSAIEPVGIGNEYEPTETGLYYYYIYYRSARPFDTYKLVTNVYRYEVGDYRKVIAKYSETVEPQWYGFYTRGLFLKPGRYKFEVFRANGEPFSTNFVHLKEPKKE